MVEGGAHCRGGDYKVGAGGIAHRQREDGKKTEWEIIIKQIEGKLKETERE